MEVQLAAALDVEFAAAAETFKDNGGGGEERAACQQIFTVPFSFLQRGPLMELL